MTEKLIELKKLCNHFRENIIDGNKKSTYDEANTKIQFINKFFTLLDWDIDNSQLKPDEYKDVELETTVNVDDDRPKKPDYSFKIGKEIKFFVEAKKPSVNIKDTRPPAYQLRRYGNSGQVVLSILTDFEEFAVYDTRIVPNQNDNSNVARTMYFTYDEYEKNFEQIYNLFSKKAIENGSFDKYEKDPKNKKGTSRFDKNFLSLIEKWRELLAANIAKNNQELDVYSLNNSVQVIIDRLIFLRFAEDKNVEKYGLLKGSLSTDNIYSNLNKIFLKAHNKYNSGLFEKIKWISDLKINDEIFNTIIASSYFPECPYEFSIMPIEILGNIYEQLLGKIIHIKPSHEIEIEEKEEVKKAGGVVYTPQYIVKYIVQNTVGEKIKKADLANLKLTVLDPACGSGSFLVGVYSFLLEKYLEYYTDKTRLDKSLKSGFIYQVSKNKYFLSITAKQNILLKHIYGVDIDSQAVEVTKLSLLLKLMEDENTESAEKLFKHSDEKLLPDLDNNIKCGNSLIASDFYKEEGSSLFGNEERRKMNTFDWNSEGTFDKKENKWKDRGFPEIFKDGGFDCVIGNPPYVRSQQMEQLAKDYLIKKYPESASYQPDTFSFFVHKGILNLKDSGLFGYIIPNGILTNSYYEKLRFYILNKTAINVIVDLKSNVFEAVSVDTSIFILKREHNKTKIEKNKLFIGEYNSSADNKVITPKNMILQKALLETDRYVFNSNTNTSSLDIVSKIKKITITLENVVTVKAGMKVRKNFVTDKQSNDARYKKFLLGSSIKPYNLEWKGKWVCYDKSLESKFTNQAFREEEIFIATDKILVRQVMGKNRIYATVDREKYFADQSIYILLPKNNSYNSNYLLALICSQLITYFFRQTLSDRKKTFPKIKGDQIKLLPIKEIISKEEKSKHDKIVSLVEQILATQKEISLNKNESMKSVLEKKYKLYDDEIDNLVYELYGLDRTDIDIIKEVLK